MYSCSGNYTPKPRGFLRIEPASAQYMVLDEKELPYSFSVSMQTTIELPLAGSSEGWININYPIFNAKIYCNYNSITAKTLNGNIEECLKLTERAARNDAVITKRAYENKYNSVYGILFLVDGESASPIQFMLTDSVTHFFRGALYYKYKSSADSIAPVTDYIRKDIEEIIQTFHWKK